MLKIDSYQSIKNILFSYSPKFIKKKQLSLSNAHEFDKIKGTVSVILFDPPFKDGNARFTTPHPRPKKLFLIKYE